MKILSVILLIFLVYGYNLVFGQMTLTTMHTPAEDEYLTTPYCFRFTWLGPKYNEESQFMNATCSDITHGAENVPCTPPLVVTNNSNVPDTDYMWEKYKKKPNQIACRLVRGEVCARYTYTFNGAVENITYFCTKIKIVNQTRQVTSECFKQKQKMGGHQLEVCVCQSTAGAVPCNSTTRTSLNVCLLVLVFMVIVSFFV